MSYLLDNSIVISKEQYENDENKYIVYNKYELDGHYLLTQNDKAFFSIYDIAYYCKSKFPKDKLFLVAHRFTNNLNGQKHTEFYIFNTIDIFEKSLTSLITINDKELVSKQKSIQDNIALAKTLSKQENIHLILGDNVMTHEIIEYINYASSDEKIILFDNYEFNNEEEIDLKIDAVENKQSTRISDILKNVRIIEPKEKVLKKNLFLLALVFFSLIFSSDISDDLFYDSIKDTKRDIKNVNRKLSNIQRDFSFKEKINNKRDVVYKAIKSKKIYKKDVK